MNSENDANHSAPKGLVAALIGFCLKNRLIVLLGLLFLVGWGVLVAPFDWPIQVLPRDPVPVDAIPDIGENQQIVFTEWKGRSPQDVEDQVTFPLTTALLGLPSVKTIRASSNFGFSSIYIIFREEAEFYWSRSRVLEKLSSLPAGTLPPGVKPSLGPDATALGQVFWYTLEGRDEEDRPTGGWDLSELRTIQDWYVRFALQGVEGVAEVASIGGYVREYQIDVDPDAMRLYGVSLEEVFTAVRDSNLDVGARTIELNQVDYLIRGVGFIGGLDDIRSTVVSVNRNVPVTLEQIASVHLGPELRRGALDKEGVEAVGGVVVTRYGENPLATITRVKERIASIATGLPEKTLADGTVSRVTIVPFYDRAGLIRETLGTLEDALRDEVLITVIVVIVMVMHILGSLIIASVLPLAVLVAFIGMSLFGVDANIVALSGIAIAIGTIVDMGIVVTENILRHLKRASPNEDRLRLIHRATAEVGGAVLTAVLTTVISFLPIFVMQEAEGKLFRPLAFTKTFALIGAILVALTVIPVLAHVFLAPKRGPIIARTLVLIGVGLAAFGLVITSREIPLWTLAPVVAAIALTLLRRRIPEGMNRVAVNLLLAFFAAIILSTFWMPMGPGRPIANGVFVILSIGSLLGSFLLFQHFYPPILRLCLRRKSVLLVPVTGMVLAGLVIWLGASRVLFFVPDGMRGSDGWAQIERAFPGLGSEFMPPLDEGSFLLMPTLMPHASIGESLDVLQEQDRAIRAIPEVESVVGKIGRVDSALDPAPISMIETVISLKPEFLSDASGRLQRFRFDRAEGAYERDEAGDLITDPRGRPFRQWRDEIDSTDAIWDAIVDAARLTGVTSAPKLQPIAARLVMLQTGMRAPMGLKVFGPSLEAIETAGYAIERIMRTVPGVAPASVLADRVVGQPYLEIHIDREAIARHGMTIRQVQDVIEVAVGGRRVTTTVEGRERYPVRVRYLRELRDDVDDLEAILVKAAGGAQIPLRQLAEIRYARGPQMIKSEDTFLVSYVIFDREEGVSEAELVNRARTILETKQSEGELQLPPGVTYRFTGTYENQIRAERRLRLILPVALGAILILLYLQFRRFSTSLLVFTGVFVAWSGGFIMLWLYGQSWFLNLDFLGTSLRDVFQIGPINLSVAVWVGFLALFGIATDDGVIMGSTLEQVFAQRRPRSIEAIRAATEEACLRRIRPCLVTVCTTVVALLPVLSSTGRGSDVMVPMAVPTFGGMAFAVVTVLVVPVLYSLLAERRLTRT